MKKLKFLLAGVMAVSLAGALASCADGEKQTYTFTFDTRGGSSVAALELNEGEAVTRPQDPTKPMFTFGDWYSDEALTTVYTFGTMPAHDVTVYASWVDPERSVRVKYDLSYELTSPDEEHTAVADSIGRIGSSFSQPDAPVRKGYVFGGWFTDAACTQRYAFTVFPEENMTLYAQWLKDGEYAYVTYFGNGKALADPVPVLKGTAFTDPAADFFGEDMFVSNWYTNADRSNRYEGGVIGSDLNLYTTYYTRGLTFTTDGSVARYTGTSDAVIVPDLAGTQPVTAIGEGAFADRDVSSVLLPDGITSVGARAFYNCVRLSSVNLTKGVTELGEYAFAGAQRLLSFGEFSVTSIPEGAFLGCGKLLEVPLPETLTAIGAQAFADCAMLRSVSVPDAVRSIGAQAFENCTQLASVKLPASLETLGENAFAGCTALTSFTIGEGNAHFTVENGALYEDVCLVKYVGKESSFTLPAGKTAVGAYAFEGNATLTGLDLSAAVTGIARGAFRGMNALTTLTLPAALLEGGTLAAFFGAPAAETEGSFSHYIPATLTTLTLDGSLSAIADYAFYGATGLESVTGISQVKTIGDGAFAYTSVEAFALPATVTSFGARVFEGASIAAYTVDAGNNSYMAEDGCLYTKDGATLVAVPAQKAEVTVKAGTQTIADYALFGSAAQTLVIPDSVTSIGFAALGSMKALASLTVPFVGDGGENAYMGYVFGSRASLTEQSGGLTSVALTLSQPARLPAKLASVTVTKTCSELADAAFAQLPALSAVTFPEGNAITSYGAFAFYNTALTAWDLAGATKVGEAAFYATQLKEVSLPGTLGAGLGAAAFAYIDELEKVTLAEGITVLPDNLFVTNGDETETGDDGYTYTVRRSKVDHEVVIPASVTSIGSQAFLGMGTAAYFSPAYPDEQPEAYTHATRNGNFSLTFAAGSKLTSIGSYAFSCSGLEQIALPASLEAVGQNAFVYNLFLTDVTFGNAAEGSSLTSLGAFVFGGDEALMSVTLYASAVPAMETDDYGGGNAFYQTNETYVIYVPAQLVDGYKAAKGWADVKDHIRAIGAEGGNA